jgi:hypothetical protein
MYSVSKIRNPFKQESTMCKCNFNEAWRGVCGKEDCKEHKDLVCSSCGKPATHSCDETGAFVCGSPLCDDCEHTIQDNGCNGGGKLPKGLKEHCKKDGQVYTPWYEWTVEQLAENDKKMENRRIIKNIARLDFKENRITPSCADNEDYKDEMAYLEKILEHAPNYREKIRV